MSASSSLVDWLDDLCVRFLLNLPASELSSVPRLCFQVEEAQWFYEDFVRPAVAASGAIPLPHLPLRQFCLLLFQHCPLFSGFTDAQHLAAYEEFLAYKVRVPVRGAILLDERMERLVLVRGWKKGATWSFPRGKINKDERDLDCAMREVWEETGFDIATSGLLPENYRYDEQEEEGREGEGGEEKIKYIDITMREQHIRLFVFRGVPLDTPFETKTRKEISKIQWYAIKDLPGFKKNQKHASHHSEADTTSATKFYMVAPFLAPLKKWIHLQRKKDIAKAQKIARNSALSVEQATATEDDTEDQMAEHGVSVDRSREEDLKRLLSIGAPSPTATRNQTSAPVPDSNAGDLLAMLQRGAPPSNGGYAPHTPFDQINAFPPQQPETPQPHHLRDPSYGYQQQNPPPPQFPFSPQRLQQEQQRNFPIPTPNVFGPAGFPPNAPPGFQAGMPVLSPHLPQQSFPPRPNMPGPPMRFGPQGNLPFSNSSIPQHPPQPQVPPQQHQNYPPFCEAPPPQLSNPALMAPQGPQGAIGSGPSAPNASQLPPPKLNSHTLKLLDAFKSGGSGRNDPTPTPPPQSQLANPSTQPQRPASTHQTALLDLFKRTSTSEDATSSAEQQLDAPLSPALTDVTEKAPPRPRAEERRPTLNEITRTLPPSTKAAKTAKTPTPTSPPSAYVQQAKDVGVGVIVDDSSPAPSPADKRLFDPNEDAVKAGSVGRGSAEGAEAGPKRKILSRRGSGKVEERRSPGAVYGPRSPGLAPPWQQNGQPPQQQVPAPPPFTILARPGSSSREVKSPSSVVTATPASPVFRHDADTPKPAFQPQVLKRPKSGEVGGGGVGRSASVGDEEGKKEQLLALFGKGSASAARPGSRGNAMQQQQQQQQSKGANANANANADALLGLFTKTKASPQPPVSPPVSASLASASSPEPPPAPRLEPSHSSSVASPRRVPPPSPPQDPSYRQNQNQNQNQNQAHQNVLLDLFNSKSASASATNTAASKSNLLSPETPISPFTLGTPVTATAGSGPGAVVDAAAEAKVKQKQFLMGYLDQVVRGEGTQGYWDGR